MIIEELREGEKDVVGGGDCVFFHEKDNEKEFVFVVWEAKKALVGAGARALFYPTLLYNVVRNRFQPEFRWWDRVHQFILLGAVPFPTDVPCLKELGVGGVITLNEPYETLVPTSLYNDHGIEHLVIPTRDYCFAPSLSNICQAVEFIHEKVKLGQTTYVHCKAGRGRSTTIVICYLVQYMQMTPQAAYDYLRSIRPRVLLASAQQQAVQEYYRLKVKKCDHINMNDLIPRSPRTVPSQDLVSFDDSSVVIVTKTDLDGYDPSLESGHIGSDIWADLSVVYRVGVAGKSALARISCLALHCRAHERILGNRLNEKRSCSVTGDHLGGGINVDIHVY